MAPKSPFRILFSRGSIRTVETIGFIRLFKEDQNRDDTLRKTSENALEQIRDRKYFHGLKGDVLMHGKRYAERMSWCHPIPCPCDPLPENIHKCSGEDRSPYKATVEDLKP